MPVPLALNIFGPAKFLWLSKFDGANWATQTKVIDTVATPAYAFTFWSAGAVGANQVAHLGIVGLDSGSPSGLTFFKNGPPDSPIQLPKIDASANQYGIPQNTYRHQYGAFYHNGIYWLFLTKQYTVTGQPVVKIVAWRSDNDGVTWTEQDLSNSPIITNLNISSANQGDCHNIYWDGASDVFTIFASVITGGGTTAAQVFNFDASANAGLGGWSIVTNQFTASGSSSITRNLSNDGGGWAFPLSNGNILAIYSTSQSANNGTFVQIATGGIWGGATLIKSSPNKAGVVCFDPSTDIAYVFNFPTGFGNGSAAPPTPFNGGVDVYTVDINGTASGNLFTFPTPVGNIDPMGSYTGYTDGIDNAIIINGVMYTLYDDWNDTSNAVWAWDMSIALNAGPGFVKLNLLPHPSEEDPSGQGFSNPPSCGMLFFGEILSVNFTHSFKLTDMQTDPPLVNFRHGLRVIETLAGNPLPPPGPPPVPGPDPRHCNPSEE
jgi:hypothetical protein